MNETLDGYEIMFLLMGAFRRSIDDLHDELASEGFPNTRPAHGFALQAIGSQAVSITELGRRLGVSKQAAAKTVGALEKQGYVTRDQDPADARASLVRRSSQGIALLAASKEIFARRQQQWVEQLGEDRYDAFVTSLRVIGGNTPVGDFSAWLQSSPDSSPSS